MGEQIQEDFQQYQEDKELVHNKQTIELCLKQHRRVMTPIIIQNKLFGYCSFIYNSGEANIREIDTMILERAATVCSLYLLNEKSKF